MNEIMALALLVMLAAIIAGIGYACHKTRIRPRIQGGDGHAEAVEQGVREGRSDRMSATDELRCMLDERGVEHGDVESAPYPPYNSTRRMTTFWANKWVWQYIEDEREGGDIELEGRYMSTSVTPEQAITATLGKGTCHMNESDLPVFNGHDDGYFSICSECGFAIYMRRIWAPLKYCSNCGRKVVDA